MINSTVILPIRSPLTFPVQIPLFGGTSMNVKFYPPPKQTLMACCPRTVYILPHWLHPKACSGIFPCSLSSAPECQVTPVYLSQCRVPAQNVDTCKTPSVRSNREKALCCLVWKYGAGRGGPLGEGSKEYDIKCARSMPFVHFLTQIDS